MTLSDENVQLANVCLFRYMHTDHARKVLGVRVACACGVWFEFVF